MMSASSFSARNNQISPVITLQHLTASKGYLWITLRTVPIVVSAPYLIESIHRLPVQLLIFTHAYNLRFIRDKAALFDEEALRKVRISVNPGECG
jgi:hypothetical protein